jgi:hypothetical protein
VGLANRGQAYFTYKVQGTSRAARSSKRARDVRPQARPPRKAIWQNEAKSNCVGEIRRYAGSLAQTAKPTCPSRSDSSVRRGQRGAVDLRGVRPAAGDSVAADPGGDVVPGSARDTQRVRQIASSVANLLQPRFCAIVIELAASWVGECRKKVRVGISDCHKLLGRKMGRAQ